MDQPIPQWLTNDFLTQCIQNEENTQNIVVTNFIVSPAAPPGNNYSSCIIRVKVEYRVDEDINSISFIIKSELTESALTDMFGILEQDESMFYKQFIPEAAKLTEISFAPKSFFSALNSTIVLEDLKEKGFIMGDRIKQLDFEHCCLYAVAAASLHAISFAVNKTNPELIESIGKEKYFLNDSKKAETFKMWIRHAFNCLSDRIERINKVKNQYCNIIKDTSETLWDMVVEAHKPSKVMNTINQGDVWTCNMMFKYSDDGAVNEVKLLDFQMLRYGSPINDLVYFIWTSANHDVKRNKLDELYQIYFDAFNKKLRELNCTESLTFENFMDNIRKLSPLAIFIVGAFLPLIFDPAPIDFLEFAEKDEQGENPYEKYYNENFSTNHLPKLLEQLEIAGVFKYLEEYKDNSIDP